MKTLPFTVTCLDHLVLRVRDLAVSERFYLRVLGCHVVKRRNDLGLLHLRVGASMVDLVSLDGRLGRERGAGPGLEGRNLDHFCIRIDRFDEIALRHHLLRHGVTPHSAAAIKYGAEGDGWSLCFSDPDDNIIELKGPKLGTADRP